MTITYDASPIAQIVAGESLASYRFHFVKLNSSGQVVHCDTVGERPLGILQNAPASGEMADVLVQPGIRSKLRVGGSVAIPNNIKTNASGRGIAAQAAYTNTSDAGAAQDALVGSFVAAMVTDKPSGTTADGDYVQVMLVQGGAIPTTAA